MNLIENALPAASAIALPVSSRESFIRVPRHAQGEPACREVRQGIGDPLRLVVQLRRSCHLDQHPGAGQSSGPSGAAACLLLTTDARVEAGAAVDRIGARTAVHRVVAVATAQGIVAVPAFQDVSPRVALQPVVPGATDQVVVARPPTSWFAFPSPVSE